MRGAIAAPADARPRLVFSRTEASAAAPRGEPPSVTAGGPAGAPATGGGANMRRALAASALVHGMVLLAACGLAQPRPADDVTLESIAVSLIATQTASDGRSQTESDATRSMIAAGAISASDLEPVATPEQSIPEAIAPVEAQRVEAIGPRAATVSSPPPTAPSAAVAEATVVEAAATSPARAPAVHQVVAAQPASASPVAEAPPNASMEPTAAAISLHSVEAPQAIPAPAPPVAPLAKASVASEVAPPVDPAGADAPPVEAVALAAPVAVAAPPVHPVRAVAPHAENPPAPRAARPRPDQAASKSSPAPARARPHSPAAGRAGQNGIAKSSAAAAPSPPGGAGRIDRAGNGADSRYPGLVEARLRRALRRPATGGFGEVRVGFTVAANGAVTGIHVVASSGSPVLDQAAADTVARAAPFPPIPPAAGRTSWSFVMPLTFRR